MGVMVHIMHRGRTKMIVIYVRTIHFYEVLEIDYGYMLSEFMYNAFSPSFNEVLNSL
jgi:hypothetical protein